ncbi:MAG: DUF2007 domain-containing protein [Melioribacteraceae bacterium]|nr:DUF2007 domain-containing protein [Melioribacteraceae bacterium]
MICPNCKAEYIDGITFCNDCNTELIPLNEFIDYDNIEISLSDWKEVYKTSDYIEAEMIKTNLASAGIDAVIFSKEDRMRLNLSYVGSAPIKIFVKQNDLETALEILNDINNSKIEDDTNE